MVCESSQTERSRVFVNARIPTDVEVVSSLLSGKGKWSSDSRGGCLKGDATHFKRYCNASKHWANKGRAKAIRASHGPRVNLQSQAKRKVKSTKENPKDCPEEPRVRTKVPKAHTEMGQVDTDTSWIHEDGVRKRNEDWSFYEWNDDRSFVG